MTSSRPTEDERVTDAIAQVSLTGLPAGDYVLALAVGGVMGRPLGRSVSLTIR
jgi:hypothetical protein